MFRRYYMVEYRYHKCLLNADIHDDDTVLVTPPPILVKMDIVKPNTVWHVKKAIYGLEKLRVYGRKSETKSSVIWSSCTKTSLPTLFKATFIPAFGS